MPELWVVLGLRQPASSSQAAQVACQFLQLALPKCLWFTDHKEVSMAAHPRPPLEPSPAGKKKQPTEIKTRAVKNRFLETMRSVADTSGLQEHLSALMK